MRFILAVTISLSCAFVPPGQTIERGRECWVFRSVLDSKARMVTAALHPDLWVSYDANLCYLYKAWKEGVKLDGAVFTNRHGPQPTSIGNDPLIVKSEKDSVWKVYNGNTGLRTVPRFKGYILKDDKVFFQYDLEVAGLSKPVHIEENPEYTVLPKTGQHGLVRTYIVTGLPDGHHIELAFSAGCMQKKEDLVTFAPIQILKKEEVYEKDKTILALAGRLTFPQNGQFTLTNYFFADRK